MKKKSLDKVHQTYYRELVTTFLHLPASHKYSGTPFPPPYSKNLHEKKSLKRAAQSRQWVLSLFKEILFSLCCQFQQKNHCAPSQLFLIHCFRLQSLSQGFSIFSHTYWQEKISCFQKAILCTSWHICFVLQNSSVSYLPFEAIPFEFLSVLLNMP